MDRPMRAMPPAGKLGLLGSLYFSQGLPFGFFVQALPVVMRERGYSLTEIGLTSMLAWPWGLKFLWAPVVDRVYAPAIGRRKSWILPLQLASFVVLSALAVIGTGMEPTIVLGAVFLLNLICATQDIATDGLAVDVLRPAERGLANGVQVAGYRMGMIVGGGALLVLYERLGFTTTFLTMAAMIGLASVPVLITREPEHGVAVPEPERAADARHALETAPTSFFRRPGALAILLLIVTYKVGDAFGTAMLRPFLVDAGFGLADIGWLLGTVGFVAGLVGALAGGALVNRVGRRRSLLLFGGLQASALAAYALLATTTPDPLAVAAATALEHFAGGMATVALFTTMMDFCSDATSATDYTVQASAVVIATGMAQLLAGPSAEAIGYVAHFALACALGLAALGLVFRFFPAASPR